MGTILEIWRDLPPHNAINVYTREDVLNPVLTHARFGDTIRFSLSFGGRRFGHDKTTRVYMYNHTQAQTSHSARAESNVNDLEVYSGCIHLIFSQLSHGLTNRAIQM